MVLKPGKGQIENEGKVAFIRGSSLRFSTIWIEKQFDYYFLTLYSYWYREDILRLQDIS